MSSKICKKQSRNKNEINAPKIINYWKTLKKKFEEKNLTTRELSSLIWGTGKYIKKSSVSKNAVKHASNTNEWDQTFGDEKIMCMTQRNGNDGYTFEVIETENKENITYRENS